MGTLGGFPYPPAMGSVGHSPTSPDAIISLTTPAMGSVGHSPTSPDAIIFPIGEWAETQLSGAVCDGERPTQKFRLLSVLLSATQLLHFAARSISDSRPAAT
jgi:hypothetical protein